MQARNIQPNIVDLGLKRKKMVFLSGPRQCGKTTLCKELLADSKLYYNWDSIAVKKMWSRGSDEFADIVLSHPNPRILLDEFHKNKKWKNQLKAFYDSYGDKIEIMLTGSAKLNTFRKGADSLLGRFIHFHLHPFSIGELQNKRPISFSEFVRFITQPEPDTYKKSSTQIKELLFQFGGFPEPFQSQRADVHQIWSQNRIELLIRQDMKDLSNILNVGQVEVLASFLPDRVGSPLSVKSLTEDLDAAQTTVVRWLNALSMVYYHFEIKPFTTSIPRTLKKEGKIYLHDWSTVENPGSKFENMVASHLLKLVHFYNDTGQAQLDLHYLRNKEKEEVDFLVSNKKKPLFTVEAKLNDLTLSKTFEKYQQRLKVPHFQIVSTPGIFRKFKTEESISSVISFETFFENTP